MLNTYHATQCTPFDDSDGVPQPPLMTHSSLASIKISKENILGIIRALDHNKSNGLDKLFPLMKKHCNSSVPLKIIFETSFREGIFLDNWKMSCS